MLQAVVMLDQGEARVADPTDDDWVIHGWLQKACILYFSVAEMAVMDVAPYQFYGKVPLKRDLEAARVRVVPTGTVRYGSYIEPGVVVMPSTFVGCVLPGTLHFRGEMDELTFYDRRLLASELLKIAQAGNALKCKDGAPVRSFAASGAPR